MNNEIGFSREHSEREGPSKPIIERLRAMTDFQSDDFGLVWHHDLVDALAELERAYARIAMLKDAVALCPLDHRYRVGERGLRYIPSSLERDRENEDEPILEFQGTLRELIEAASNVYTNEGVTLFLKGANKHLDGRAAMDVWDEDYERVLNLLEAMAHGASL